MIKSKKYCNYLLFICLFILGGCEDKLNELSATELLSEAKTKYETAYYEDTIRFLENFELRFPTHKEVPNSVYQRALAYYKDGKYAQAVAVFEVFLDRYPSSPNKIDAHKYLFYCFYNQVMRYDRDYALIEQAFKYGKEYSQFVYQDEAFDQAYANLNKFMAHYYLHIAHYSLDSYPKLWIQMLWSSSRMINEHPENEESAEAYYRIIEFLCAQNNQHAHEDAIFVLNKMKLYYENSPWYLLAQKCIFASEDIARAV